MHANERPNIMFRTQALAVVAMPGVYELLQSPRVCAHLRDHALVYCLNARAVFLYV